MRIPKEFDFKSNINDLVDSYHAKEMPQGYYKVTCNHEGKEHSWNFTKEEMENRISGNAYIIIGDETLMENYICINGKKAELTEEQMKALGIEVPNKNPFNKAKFGQMYYFINRYGVVDADYDNDTLDVLTYEAANYCTDKAILEQRALHEWLNRLLWRYAMEHGGEGHFEICHNGEKFIVQNAIYKYLGQTFRTHAIAEAAIKEIVEPFMKAHPEFKW